MSNKKISILFLGTQMEIAGAQRVLLSQARWFHNHGYPVEVVFFYDKQGLLRAWQSQNHFPVISLDAWKTGAFPLVNLFKFLVGLKRLFLLARKKEVIITFTPHSNLIGLPAAYLAGIPIRIGTHHGYIEGSSTQMAKLHGWLTNSRFCTKMVAVSEQVRQFALRREGARKEKLVVIENGIEPLAITNISADKRKKLRDEFSLNEGDLLFLTVGRLAVQKGHSVLLDAVARIKSGSTKVVYAFAGDGPLFEQLLEKTEQLKISHLVKFLGVRSDVNELLLASEAFVQPSLWEGLSLALLEALFLGLPVLATRVEGVVDVVENGESGILVPPNDPNALAEALEELVSDSKLRERLGHFGRERVRDKYSVDRMCLSYEELVQSVEDDR